MREMVSEQMRQEMEAAEEALEFTPVKEVDDDTQYILKEYNVTDAAIAQLKTKYTGLAIQSVEDRKGYDLVHSARMEVREFRIAVEKKRKTLKENSLEYGRKVDKEAKRITAALEAIEAPLEAEEKRIDAERERIKAEAQREKEAKLQRRIDALTAVGAPVNVGDLVSMPDTTFSMVLEAATEAWNIKEAQRREAEAALAAKQEAERLETERKAREEAEAKAKAEKAERERLAAIAEENAKEAARLAAIKAEQDKQAAELRKAQEAIDKQKADLERAAREEQIRKEAEARAKAEAERKAQEEAQRKEAEAKAAAERQALEDRRRKEREAARPDADKILALAESVRGTAFPKMITPGGQLVMVEIEDAVRRLANFIEAKAAAISDRVMA